MEDQLIPFDLVAVGGRLSVSILIEAYQKGLFPWYEEKEESPCLWYSPLSRLVLRLEAFRVPRSLRKVLRKRDFVVTFDTNCVAVMEMCAAVKRKEQKGTWLHRDMLEAYKELHKKGVVHSVEVYRDNDLVGGLYGVSGTALKHKGCCIKGFFGESMFHLVPDASKVAFVYLVGACRMMGMDFVDCQTTHATHLLRLGARVHTRKEFYDLLRVASVSASASHGVGIYEHEAALFHVDRWKELHETKNLSHLLHRWMERECL